MPGRNLKIGIIGCGKHAIRSHVEVLKSQVFLKNDVAVVAAYDPNSSAVTQVLKLYPDLYIASSEAALLEDTEVEAVVIATPPEYHLDLSRKAIGAGKHVLCEKPLWADVNDERLGRKVFEEAAEKNLIFTSCHPRRFENIYAEIKKILPFYREKFGKLLSFDFTFRYHKPPPGWRQKDSLLLDHMNHEVDLISFLFGPKTMELIKKEDSFDSYLVIGYTSDKMSILFDGTRRLEAKIYGNNLNLLFERGTVIAKSTLKDNTIRAEISALDNEDEETKIYAGQYPASEQFSLVMYDFWKSICSGSENYLKPEEMILNTVSCNSLVETGLFNNLEGSDA